MDTTTEEEDAEIEHFLDISDCILDHYEEGHDITDEVRNLRLPRVRTQRVSYIYNELKSLVHKSKQEEERPEKMVEREKSREPSRPVSPAESHSCRCVHLVIPRKNDALQLKDFVYLSFCIFIGVVVYFYLYGTSNLSREPIY